LTFRIGIESDPDNAVCNRESSEKPGVGEAIGYIISQLIGGVVGALLLRTVLGGKVIEWCL
jgi:hypothetical protein